jgi:hypothetical protein
MASCHTAPAVAPHATIEDVLSLRDSVDELNTKRGRTRLNLCHCIFAHNASILVSATQLLIRWLFAAEASQVKVGLLKISPQ